MKLVRNVTKSSYKILMENEQLVTNEPVEGEK